MPESDVLEVELILDTSRFDAAITRMQVAVYPLTRWRRQRADPCPFPRVSLRRKRPHA